MFEESITQLLKRIPDMLRHDDGEQYSKSVADLIDEKEIYAHPAFLSMQKLYFDYLNKKANEKNGEYKILDAGCGIGINTLYLSNLITSASVNIMGIDINPDSILLANHFKDNPDCLSDYVKNHTNIPDSDTILPVWLDELDNGSFFGENVNFIQGDLSEPEIPESDGILLLESLFQIFDCQNIIDAWSGDGSLLFSTLGTYYFMNKISSSIEKPMTYIINYDYPNDCYAYHPPIIAVLTENTSLNDGKTHILNLHRYLGDCSFEGYEIKHIDSNGIVLGDIKLDDCDSNIIYENLPLQLRTKLYGTENRCELYYDDNYRIATYRLRIETSDIKPDQDKLALAEVCNDRIHVDFKESAKGNYYEVFKYDTIIPQSSVNELAIRLYELENSPMRISLI